jgi:hypothetical protein
VFPVVLVQLLKAAEDCSARAVALVIVTDEAPAIVSTGMFLSADTATVAEAEAELPRKLVSVSVRVYEV